MVLQPSSSSPPSGGITVTFEGMNLDAGDRPVFVFTDSRLTSSDQVC